MAFTRAWRNFKRMQDLTVAAAVLIYAAGVIEAQRQLPGGPLAVMRWTVLLPATYLLGSLVLPLTVPAAKRWLAKYVWMSFQAGFGQTPGSVLVGVGLLSAAGGFIYWQIGEAAQRGQVGINIFSAFAAGIGILAAQAVLVRVLEKHPEVRKVIEV